MKMLRGIVRVRRRWWEQVLYFFKIINRFNYKYETLVFYEGDLINVGYCETKRI